MSSKINLSCQYDMRRPLPLQLAHLQLQKPRSSQGEQLRRRMLLCAGQYGWLACKTQMIKDALSDFKCRLVFSMRVSGESRLSKVDDNIQG